MVNRELGVCPEVLIASSSFSQKPLEWTNNVLKQTTMEKNKFQEMFDRLPSNIRESDMLRLESKKVLAALLELLLHSEARNTGVIYCGNKLLRKLSGVGSDNFIPALNQLEDYELITRIKGSVRSNQNEKGQASEYIINFKKLKEPIIEKTFDDLFSQFCEEAESSETPISTTTTITTSTTTPISTSTPITTSTTTPISTSTPISISTTTPISTSSAIQTQEDER